MTGGWVSNDGSSQIEDPLKPYSPSLYVHGAEPAGLHLEDEFIPPVVGMKQFNSYVVIVNNRFLEGGWKSRFNLEQLRILVRQLNCSERLNGTFEGILLP
jgi:hypothetical protein